MKKDVAIPLRMLRLLSIYIMKRKKELKLNSNIKYKNYTSPFTRSDICSNIFLAGGYAEKKRHISSSSLTKVDKYLII